MKDLFNQPKLQLQILQLSMTDQTLIHKKIMEYIDRLQCVVK
jgi:hypothetical protein